ncbi:prolipoprotein diacylglyceryl transferase [Fluviispira vulneris]|uniref:prolipoprotein diacylglyceryl transferase n=1 Tax=Fluviispira vulneris TaxID=2763012 RepID=UPI001C95B5FD|nr:prolipoprotein diacylglyceryl transferase [Fluviispira vulneris]
MNPSYQYWRFDLSPYVFQVMNINFNWVTTIWGASLLIIFFGTSLFLTRKKISSTKKLITNSNQNENKLKLNKLLTRFEYFETILIYVLGIFIILFTLQKMNIHWGLRWYSTMYLIGFMAVYFSCMHWIKKKSLMMTENMLMNLILACILGMLIGARSAYVFIYNWDLYKDHPLDAIATWEGGLSFHGGIVGVSLALLIFCRKYKIPFFHLSDKLALVVPIGIGMGRIGNFFNGELWGRPISSHVPWAIIFPDGGPLPRHPSQIYQSLAEGWGLFLTLFIISRFKQKEGTLSACFVIFYGFYRFIVEYFRAADPQLNYYSLTTFTWEPLSRLGQLQWWQYVTMGQILNILTILAGILFLFLTRRNIQENSTEWLNRINTFYKTHKIEKS